MTTPSIERALGRIEGQLTSLQSDVDEMKPKLDALEGWKFRVTGIASAFAAVISICVSYIIGR